MKVQSSILNPELQFMHSKRNHCSYHQSRVSFGEAKALLPNGLDFSQEHLEVYSEMKGRTRVRSYPV